MGGNYVAADTIWYVDETVWVGGWYTVRADMPDNYDVLYGDVCDGVFVHVLSLDVKRLNFSFGKEKFSKRNQLENQNGSEFRFDFWIW